MIKFLQLGENKCIAISENIEYLYKIVQYSNIDMHC